MLDAGKKRFRPTTHLMKENILRIVGRLSVLSMPGFYELQSVESELLP